MSISIKNLWSQKKSYSLPENPNEKIEYDENTLSEIWFAGGCFWGVQAFFARIYGVAHTAVGYANGMIENPTYKDIPHSGHAETVYIKFDKSRVSIQTLLEYFFRIIDPLSENRQGNDIGEQYRSGIYYNNEDDKLIILDFLGNEQKKYSARIATEVKPILNFYLAEDYHQDYLEKNPSGYCHVDFSSLKDMEIKDDTSYIKPSDEQIKKTLSDTQYRVTQLDDTEPPFLNEYWDNDKKGIYVDIVTKQPLFVSSDKFHSNCGWPSFSKPIEQSLIVEKSDNSHMMRRTEVKSKLGDTHLGHIFDDGPKEFGGMRYCINSASLEFIPLEKMKEAGYEKYIYLVE